MDRSALLFRFAGALRELARQKAAEEAQRAGWPLPLDLAVHLWLRGLGFGTGRSDEAGT